MKRAPVLFLVRKGREPSSGLAKLGFEPEFDSESLIVSLGYEDLTFSRFKAVLDAFRPKVVFDLRASPSFRDRGFSVARAFETMKLMRVEYLRFGDSWKCLVENQPRRDAASLDALLRDSLVRQKCVILLGAITCHSGSERERLVEHIALSLNVAVVHPVNESVWTIVRIGPDVESGHDELFSEEEQLLLPF